MRESFGGAFMIKLVLVFIVVYISFMAVAINYAKAFRVKNQVINILEQYKYKGNIGDEAFIKLNEYLPSVPYNLGDKIEEISDKCSEQATNLGVKADKAVVSDYGVCLISMTYDMNDSDVSPRYYMVTTYIAIDFPFFNISMILPIVGETKSIY